MTDQERAEEYVDTLLNKDDAEIDKFLDENLGDLQLNKRQAETILGIIKGVGICSFLSGLKAGRSKWHDLRKDPNDLPLNSAPVLCLGSTGYIICKYISGSWVDNQTIKLVPKYIDIYKWCEIEDTGGINYV